MKLRYVALAAAMAFSAPAFAAPSSNLNTVPPYGTQIGGVGGEAYINPSSGQALTDSKTYTLASGWYTFGIAAKAVGASIGSFGAVLTDLSESKTYQELSLVTTKTSPVLFDAVNNFHLDAGVYKITIAGTAFGAKSEGAAAIYNGVAPVPGPEAGAGIGALAMGGIALYLKRRRKDETVAA